MNWDDAFDGLETDPYIDAADLKQKLPIHYVVETEFGLAWETVSNRMITLCPFHHDNTPSFAIFGDNMKAGCWSCGWRGDVFDLIQYSREVSFTDALAMGAKMVADFDGEIPKPLIKKSPPVSKFTLLDASRTFWRTAQESLIPIQQLCVKKGIRISPETLHKVWMIGVVSFESDGAVSVPHFGPNMELTGYKVRVPSSPWIAARGSKFPWLYGVWRDTNQARVFLTEGESDTWTIDALDHGSNTFGLPTGAHSVSEHGSIPDAWLRTLQGREVITVFDGDEAGQIATKIWKRKLEANGIQHQSIDLPTGRDATNVSTTWMTKVINAL